MIEGVARDHTKELMIKAHNKDKAAREQLVLENMGLIRSCIKRFANRGFETEDLFQIGCIGLIKAIDNFNMDYEVKFSTYAVPMIVGEIKRFLRDDGMIKVSRSIKENASKCAKASEEFKGLYFREPTIEEIAVRTGLAREDIVLSYFASQEVESIYKTVYQSDGSEVCLADKLEENKDIGEEVTRKLTVEQLIGGLKENEKRIIFLRYYDDKTQMEVARELGISQVQVSRIEKKILSDMRIKLQK